VPTRLARACTLACTLSCALALSGALSGALSCSRPAPRTHRVAIKNFLFAPASITVAVGDTVEWTNADIVPHTATARDSSWDSKPIDGSGTWRFVARAAGRHAYYCVAHPNMQGTLEVR
jgi:plastocyanin